MTETRLTKGKIFIDLLIGLAAIAVLLAVKVYVEHTYIGRWLNARGYEVLHTFIPPFEPENDLPVAVVDISDLKRDPDCTTPAGSLKEIVEALVASRAKAIAINIDFSTRIDRQDPASAGPRHEDDPLFFEFLREQKSGGAHVFVGARNIGVEPKTWLGQEEYRDFAAEMIAFDEDITQVPMWLHCDGSDRLNSISNALAEVSKSRPPPPGLLKGLLVDPQSPENLKPTVKEDKAGNRVSCRRAFTFVNYAKLELIQRVTLQATNAAAVLSFKDEEGRSRFEDKLVIIGETQRGKASDCFVVPGRLSPVSGTHVLASATYSLVDEPVYKFKHGVIIVLDVLLGLFIVLGVLYVRWRHRAETGFPSHLLESRFILFSILITLLLGFILVRFLHVLWLDFSLVVFALFLHSKVQEAIRRLPSVLFRMKRPHPAGTE